MPTCSLLWYLVTILVRGYRDLGQILNDFIALIEKCLDEIVESLEKLETLHGKKPDTTAYKKKQQREEAKEDEVLVPSKVTLFDILRIL